MTFEFDCTTPPNLGREATYLECWSFCVLAHVEGNMIFPRTEFLTPLVILVQQLVVCPRFRSF